MPGGIRSTEVAKRLGIDGADAYFYRIFYRMD